jgi:hypothetical protein
LEPSTIEKLIDRIERKPWDQVTSWDEAAQRYLALVPLYQSWRASSPSASPRQEASLKSLEERFKRLKFAEGFDSPRTFEPDVPRSQQR